MTEAFPMIGGDGTKSYAKNSTYQRISSDAVQGMIDEAIAVSFDVSNFVSAASNTIRIADLGCSVGPNTFFAMKNVLEAIEKKCQSESGLTSGDVEYQVFFNDHSSNDFNTLFTSFPPDKIYYAAGVPGSFYDQLFPSSSIHFIYSSNSLHWISNIPKELVDQNSPAWNKGKIHYGSSSSEVAKAYAAQFGTDMKMFLNARANEMVKGGMMVLIILMPSLPEGDHISQVPMNWMSDFLASILMDMVNSGSITEDQLDSFNLPWYFPTVKDMTEIVRNNRRFSITTIEVNTPNLQYMDSIPLEGLLMQYRSVTEQVFVKHFGQEVVIELFERALKKIPEISHLLRSSKMRVHQLFVVLKRE